MQNPANLQVAALARSLAIRAYRATADFPAQERFGLVAQMRRAAVSIGSNIYEGCSRGGAKEFTHFLRMALGSVSELEFQTLLATDLGLLAPRASSELQEATNHTKRMLLRLISAVQSHAGSRRSLPAPDDTGQVANSE
jgi:four helix bundle protein